MTHSNTNIFLVRHGQTQWNKEKRWQGSQNSNLTSLGIKQAQQTKELIDEQVIDFAYVSPLQRAQDTIELILKDKNIKAIVLDDIRELNIGPWEGNFHESTQISHPLQYHNFWHEPESFSLDGAETFVELQNRVVKSLDELFFKHKGTNILVVSHWISIKVAVAHYLEKEISELPFLNNPKNAELIHLCDNGKKISIS